MGSIRPILRASGPANDDVSKSRGSPKLPPCPHWHWGSLQVLELNALLEAAQLCWQSALRPDMLCSTVGLISAGREAHQDHYLLLGWPYTCPPALELKRLVATLAIPASLQPKVTPNYCDL